MKSHLSSDLRFKESRVAATRIILATGLSLACLASNAAVLTVTNFADSGPGTLRERIAAASSGDSVVIGSGGTVTLNSPVTISNNLTVQSFGSQLARISGNNATRVLNITSGNVLMVHLFITDGHVVGTNGAAGKNGENVRGGGLLIGSGASVHLLECLVSNNVAWGGQAGSGATGGNGMGGGIANLGSVNLDSSLLISNYCLGGSGGGLDSGGQAWGGGLYSELTALVQGTALHGNIATGGAGGSGNGSGTGGAIYNAGTTTVIESTLFGNAASGSAFDFGGGIDNLGTLTIRDSTIYGNQADYGGGITGGDIGNTILAGNSAATGPDGTGVIASSDYNLVQATNGISFTGITTHNVVGVNPLLAPADRNSIPSVVGVTALVPLAGSPVIDKGKGFYSNDQGGRARPYDGTIANAGGGNGADIGAIEVYPGTLMVVNANPSGPGSLRQALADNSGLGGSNVIVFSNSVAGTIALGGVPLTLAAPALVRGPGPEKLSVSGGGLGRVFLVVEGPSEISGLTIRDGAVTGTPGAGGQQNGSDAPGGGIYSQADLVLSNCVVLSNNVVGGVGADRQNGVVGNGGRGLGGGLYSAGGKLKIVRATFTGNRATGGRGGFATQNGAGQGGNGLGGAICALGGSNLITECSLPNNRAEGGLGGGSGGGGAPAPGGQGYGGSIYSETPTAIYGSAIFGGTAVGGNAGDGTSNGSGSGYGGGLYAVSDLVLQSSCLASNVATGSSFDFGGAVYSAGSASITNCTIAANQADYGGGWNGSASVANSIFALNAASFGPDFNGMMTSFDFNLVQNIAGLNVTGATGNSFYGLSPMLAPLQNNGGPTLTMALLPGSPAIDKGRSFGLIADQRGFNRIFDLASIPNAPGGDGADMGSYEYLPSPQLFIQSASNAGVVLNWDTDATDFLLESASNLPPANIWTTVTNSRSAIGNQIYVTNSALGVQKVYRLRLPTSPPPH